MISFYIQVTTKNRIDIYPAFLLYILFYCGLYCRVVCITRNFSESQNPRFIIESGFKPRVVMMARVRYIYLLQAIQIIQLGMENPVRRPSRFPGFIRVWWVKVFSVCAVAECYQRSKKWKPSASFRSNSMKETGDQRGGTSEVSQCTMSYCF